MTRGSERAILAAGRSAAATQGSAAVARRRRTPAAAGSGAPAVANIAVTNAAETNASAVVDLPVVAGSAGVIVMPSATVCRGRGDRRHGCRFARGGVRCCIHRGATEGVLQGETAPRIGGQACSRAAATGEQLSTLTHRRRGGGRWDARRDIQAPGGYAQEPPVGLRSTSTGFAT